MEMVQLLLKNPESPQKVKQSYHRIRQSHYQAETCFGYYNNYCTLHSIKHYTLC